MARECSWNSSLSPDSAAFRAFRLLHIGFVALPIIAGVDKFTNLLAQWDQYLAPRMAQLLPIEIRQFMQVVGVIEIFAGILVLFSPRLGGYIVAGWLWGIILNLLMWPGYFDIALRDFGLSLGAIALAWLASHYEQSRTSAETVETPEPMYSERARERNYAGVR